MEHDAFAKIVEAAIQSVPKELLEKIENVAFVIEDDSRPPGWRERGIVVRQYLLGLYQGVPLTKRGIHYSLVLPDTITIFQKPIEELGQTEAGIRKLVHEVVHHEIGHYFGIDEPTIRKLEAQRKAKK